MAHQVPMAFWMPIILFAFLLPSFTCLEASPDWLTVCPKDDGTFLKSSRFLFFRFRPDCWWYGCWFILRGPMLAVPMAIFTDLPQVQLFVMTAVLAARAESSSQRAFQGMLHGDPAGAELSEPTDLSVTPYLEQSFM